MRHRRRLATKYTRLPLELREEIEAKVREGGMSSRELFRLVLSRQPDADISERTLRHQLYRYRAEQRHYGELREVGGAYADMLLKNSGGVMGPLVAEMLRLVAFEQLAQGDDREAGDGEKTRNAKARKTRADEPRFARPEARELLILATVLERVANADKLTIEHALKAQQKKAAEQNADKGTRRIGGLSDDAADKIRRALFGDPDEFKNENKPPEGEGE